MKRTYKHTWVVVCISWKKKYSASYFDSKTKAWKTYKEWSNMISGYDILKPQQVFLIL